MICDKGAERVSFLSEEQRVGLSSRLSDGFENNTR